ncbi:hypothetical protein N781_14625 [Pontibacillus halophilus JSM 076056 = DSM 19796]|uniref:Uncharacterized protein n=1 Tax=Pontibacillus halophilus JSM 076056 = DSM 19796 TaxID=1385510 RepID=A0A0A5GNE5_9BACI|nr:hypothetical protein [Pontibacillus halophilus]KGX92773.1 hypothetical protein N781_14625 [Pontibacillus halophilus JSM 076056 = DSM 19796]
MVNETVVIEGSISGMKFSKPIRLQFDPNLESVEEAIIRFYFSEATSFEELASERGWRNADWTFPLVQESVAAM